LRLKTLLITFAVLLLVTHSPRVRAADFSEDQPSATESGDSTFDPFSDYTEFEEGSEEEADTNFFRNGRFLSLGILAGYESFTDILGQMYKPDFGYGLALTYFFDLKFGFQASFMTADHAISIIDARTATNYVGKVNLQHFEFDGKYFFNTQNVTKGLGAFNPYLIIGFSQYTRTQTFNGATGFARDTAMGLQGGAGVEIPFMKNKMYFGLQGMYNYVAFADRNAPIVINGAATSIFPTGDALTFLGLLGINF
jgi:hypothetical protein